MSINYLYIYVHVQYTVLVLPVNLILLKNYLNNKELNLICRITDALFHALLLWYYSTLTLQEHILIANGSRYCTVSKKGLVSKQTVVLHLWGSVNVIICHNIIVEH